MASTFKNTAAALALIAIGAAGTWTFSRLTHSEAPPAPTAATAERKPLYWYDPMVPGQKFDKPGKSPFMDMQLVPRYADEGQPAAGQEPALVVSAQAQQALGLRLATVVLQSVAAAVDVVGSVQQNERDISIVQARTAGFVQRVFARAPGDVVAAGAPLAEVLNPEWLGAQQEYLAVRATGDTALAQAAQAGKSRLLYLVPTLQNPTTSTMSMKRREDIVAIARQYKITIIEDDIFRLLDARVQPPTLYTLAPELTFHVNSFSKSLAPGLRIGFVVAPSSHERIFRAYVRGVSIRAVGLTGEIARYWIETDIASTILNRSRNELAQLRASFLEVFKGCNFRCEPGAPYAWLELPEHWNAIRFATLLLSHKIKITPGATFQLGPRSLSRHVRICFGTAAVGWKVRKAFTTIRTLMNEPDEEEFTPVA